MGRGRAPLAVIRKGQQNWGDNGASGLTTFWAAKLSDKGVSINHVTPLRRGGAKGDQGAVIISVLASINDHPLACCR